MYEIHIDNVNESKLKIHTSRQQKQLVLLAEGLALIKANSSNIHKE